METPTFENPPIVEFVLGVQFSPLTNLTNGHFGLLWNEFGRDDWPTPGDNTPIDDQFELFDQPKWRTSANSRLALQVHAYPPVARFTLRDRNGARMLQMQPTRFHLNWKKTGGFKPSYKDLITGFEEMFTKFSTLIGELKIGTVTPNQWELTYVDSFPHGEYWDTPADWSDLLPGLFGKLFSADKDLGLTMEHRVASWSFEILPKKGRLHLDAKPGRWSEDARDSLILTTTARGPIPSMEDGGLRAGLDLGHKKSVGAFLAIVDETVKEKWGKLS